jgi:hypothetical protein
MKLLTFFFVVGCLTAAPPQCKTKTLDGTEFRICTRYPTKTNVEELVVEQAKNPSKEWNGPNWPLDIFDSHATVAQILVFDTGISFTASYMDSEKADFTVTYEREHCGKLTHVRRDVQIIIENGTPTASILIECLDQPSEVPTVEVKEKGGKKEATHIYK